MALFAYKNVAYAKQTAFGASIGVGSVYLPVKSFEMNKDSEITTVEQTTNTPKGFRRSVNTKDTVEGTAAFNVDLYNIGYWLNLGFGGGVTSAASGLSATAYTFVQDIDGNLVTGRFDADKVNAIEAWQDVFAKKIEISASDGLIEGTIDLQGSRQIGGATFTPTVTESRVVTFANATWYYGDTTGIANATKTLTVTDWKFSYMANGEGKFESGSNVISRQDTKIPTCEIEFSRFFDGTSGPLVARDNVFTEDQERAMILQITSDSDDVIAGTTPYLLKFPMPKVKLKTTERPYSSGEMVVEKVTGMAMYDDTAGYMVEPVLTTKIGVTF